jgi:hypothetical protein
MADVFINPTGIFDRLVVLSDAGLSTANPEKELIARITPEQIAQSVPAGQAQIPWSSIVKIRANRHRDDMNVTFTGADREELKNIGFKDASTRDAALRIMHKRLGPQFKWREVQYGMGRAAGVPFLVGATLGAFTYVSAMAATGLAAGERVDIHGRNRAAKMVFGWALDLLGPTGVSVIGALAISACLMWMVGRIKRPPLMVTIER